MSRTPLLALALLACHPEIDFPALGDTGTPADQPDSWVEAPIDDAWSWRDTTAVDEQLLPGPPAVAMVDLGAEGVDLAQRADEDLASGEGADHADTDLPVPAHRLDDRLHRVAQASGVGVLDLVGGGLLLAEPGQLGGVGAREGEGGPHDDVGEQDDATGVAQEVLGAHPGLAPHIGGTRQAVRGQLEHQRGGGGGEYGAAHDEAGDQGDEHAEQVHGDHHQALDGEDAQQVSRRKESGDDERVHRKPR